MGIGSAKFSGLRRTDIQHQFSGASKGKAQRWAFLSFASLSALGASLLFNRRLTWLPSNPKVQAFFGIVTVVAGAVGFKVWRDRILAQKILSKQIEADEYGTLKPDSMKALWNNHATGLRGSKLLFNCNFAQLQALWSGLSENERQELSNHFKKPKQSFTLLQIMETLKESSNEKPETLKCLLLDKDFISYMKELPGLFGAFRAVLLNRKDFDFRTIVFQMYYKTYRSDVQLPDFEQTKKVSIEITQGQRSIEMKEVDVAMLDLAGEGRLLFGNEREGPIKINLTEESEWTAENVQKMIEYFVTAEEPSLDWLIDNYKMMTAYDFEPFLYRMHSLIFHHSDHLEKYTKYTREEIAYCLTETQPKNIKKLQITWENTEVKDGNLLLAMSYSVIFELKGLSKKCQSFIPSIKDPNLFRAVFDHASRLEDQQMLQACENVFASTRNSLHTTWKNLFAMPTELINAIAGRTTLSKEIDWAGFSSRWQNMSENEKNLVNKQFCQSGAFTITQLIETIIEMNKMESGLLKELLQLESFVILIRNNPKIFGSIRDQLLARNDADFRVEIAELHFKAFLPKVKFSESKEVITLTIRKGDETKAIQNVPRAVLESAGDRFKGVDTIQLGENDRSTLVELEELIQTYLNSQEPSLDWLLDHYQTLIELPFNPFLYRLHGHLIENIDNDSYFRKYSRKEIGVLFARSQHQIENIEQEWKRVVINEKNILIAMSLSTKFSMDSVRKNCRKFIEGFRKKRGLYPSPDSVEILNDPNLFREIYEHADTLEDEDFLSFCEDTAVFRKETSTPITGAWPSLLKMPERLRKALLSKDDRFNQKDSGSNQSGLDITMILLGD